MSGALLFLGGILVLLHNHPISLSILSDIRHNWLYKRVLRKPTLGIAINLCSSAFVIGFVTSPPNFDFHSPSMNVLESIRVVDVEVYERIKEQNVIEYLVGFPIFRL